MAEPTLQERLERIERDLAEATRRLQAAEYEFEVYAKAYDYDSFGLSDARLQCRRLDEEVEKLTEALRRLHCAQDEEAQP